jgi:orotate phosphoribosyltransferase
MNSNRTSSFPAVVLNGLFAAAAIMSMMSTFLVVSGHTVGGIIMLALAIGEALTALNLRRYVKPNNHDTTAGT